MIFHNTIASQYKHHTNPRCRKCGNKTCETCETCENVTSVLNNLRNWRKLWKKVKYYPKPPNTPNFKTSFNYHFTFRITSLFIHLSFLCSILFTLTDTSISSQENFIFTKVALSFLEIPSIHLWKGWDNISHSKQQQFILFVTCDRYFDHYFKKW